MTRRVAELLLLSVLVVVAVLLHKSTAGFPQVVQNSTAAYVRFLALCLGGLAAVEFFLTVKKRSSGQEKMLDMTAAPLRFWGLLICMFGYALLLEPLGFYFASALFLPAAMVLMGARKKMQVILTSAGVLLFVYAVFAKLLSVPLPESSLF
jgi:putative tricarboxylic transport membrane protein